MIASPRLHRSVFHATPALALAAVVLAGAGSQGPQEGPGQALYVRRGGDIIASGRSVTLNDSIPGDVMAAAGAIDFNGYAGGDFLGGGMRLELTGAVGGSVRAGGGEVRIAADVGRNITAAGDDVVLERDGHVRGNAYITGGSIRIDGTVDRLLRAAGGEVVISGTVSGDVHVEAKRLRVAPGAVIDGDLRYRLEEDGTVDIASGARITGDVIALEPKLEWRGFAVLRFLLTLGFLVAGAVAVAVVPGFTARADARLREQPAPALGLGLAWLLLVPIAVAIAAITIIGVPLALAAAALYLVAAYLARAVTAVWLGRLILQHRYDPSRTGVVLAFLTGGVILVVVGFIPWVGTAVTILAAIVGLGAGALALRRPGAAPPRPSFEEALEG